ncbi:Uncharacterised protein [Vibrio cholerae]|nr:Uncharacterised protein [Vibrio cholerae]CSC38856.1 Uncharacterised protein [Vibrio cholerae]CSI40954.1 Uncharacterised protein [Vibrio cholerae]
MGGDRIGHSCWRRYRLGHGFSECAMWYLASLGLDFDHDCCVFHQHPHYGTS